MIRSGGAGVEEGRKLLKPSHAHYLSYVLVIFGIHKVSPPPSSQSYQSVCNSFISTEMFVKFWAGRSRQTQA